MHNLGDLLLEAVINSDEAGCNRVERVYGREQIETRNIRRRVKFEFHLVEKLRILPEEREDSHDNKEATFSSTLAEDKRQKGWGFY